MQFLRNLFSVFTGGDQQNLSPPCSVCGQRAATIKLSEVAGGWLLTYSGPGGSNGAGDRVTADRAAAIRLAFTPPYAAANIDRARFHDHAGFCLKCGKFYCPTHWNVSSTGGGTCPNGHFNSLDPHWSPE